MLHTRRYLLALFGATAVLLLPDAPLYGGAQGAADCCDFVGAGFPYLPQWSVLLAAGVGCFGLLTVFASRVVRRRYRAGGEGIAAAPHVGRRASSAMSMLVSIGAGILGLLIFFASLLPGLRHSIAKRRADLARAGSGASTAASPSPKSELREALSACRGAFVGVGVFSAFINILALSTALFMLEVYDRVLPSRSVPTLVGLAILTTMLLGIQGILDLVRGRILVRIGLSLDRSLSRRVHATMVTLPLRAAGRNTGTEPLRDLDAIRSFLSGLGPTALFDLPWMPIYLAIIFAFHPVLGCVALAGAIFLICVTLLTERLTRRHTLDAARFAVSRQDLAEASRRNAEALAAMGMVHRMSDLWGAANDAYLTRHRSASDVTGGFGSLSKVFRILLQSAVLGVGAYLVINQQATAGIIIAGSILTARALAPVDVAIAHWKGFALARQAWTRLSTLLEALPMDRGRLPLPAPVRDLTVEKVSVVPSGSLHPTVIDVSFTLKAGQGLGIIGPSAAGKSSLARLLVGVWQPARGNVRLDGASLDQWEHEALGRHVGYLPQDVELFPGTVAENIARFDAAARPEAIVTAAAAAGAHELIVGLPDGYDTRLGAAGLGLSAGQLQRIALARALYGDPFLVVLDEPNSNLDGAGEFALTQAMRRVRERGGIVVVVAHRPSALASVDLVLTLNQGRMRAFGPKNEILPQLVRPAANTSPPLLVVSESRAGGTS